MNKLLPPSDDVTEVNAKLAWPNDSQFCSDDSKLVDTTSDKLGNKFFLLLSLSELNSDSEMARRLRQGLNLASPPSGGRVHAARAS